MGHNTMTTNLSCVALLLLLSLSMVSTEISIVTEGVYAFNLGDRELPYTSMFVVTGDGVMIVDPINTDSAKAMLQEIRKITNEPIKYVFYSHDHWDHTSGGQVFKNEGAKIVAHKDANDWMLENTGPDQIPADCTWFGSQFYIPLGKYTMELHHYGVSHGNGMTIFVVSSQPRVAYIADLSAVKSTGPAYLPGFDTKGWENTLERTLELDFDLVVFTHSPPPGGVKEDVADQLGFVKDVRAAVRAEIDKGANPFELPSTLQLDKYKDWAGYADSFPLNVLHFAVEEAILGPYARPAEKKKTFSRRFYHKNRSV